MRVALPLSRPAGSAGLARWLNRLKEFRTFTVGVVLGPKFRQVADLVTDASSFMDVDNNRGVI